MPLAMMDFLRRPFVVGLAPLVCTTPGESTWETGPCRWLAELLTTARSATTPMGTRAAAELWVLGASILREAAATGASVGCFAHGGLSPWRVGILPGGQVTLFGYGLPMADVSAWLEDPSARPDLDHLRLSPPERLLDLGEDEASDQWALAAVVAEVATGEPLVAAGSLMEIVTEIREGRAGTQWRGRERVPRAFRAAMDPMFALDPDRRPTGARLSLVLNTLLSAELPGPSLGSFVDAPPVQVAERVALELDTAAFSREALRVAALAEDAESTPTPVLEVRRLGRTLEPGADAPISPRALRRLNR